MMIRTLLVWLLALALPMQGVAAATMAFCGQAHQAVAAADHSRHQLHADHDAHRAQLHTAEPGSDAPAAPSEAHTCSACASCCSVGAILTALPSVPLPDFAPTVFVATVTAVDAFVADGLDRPPRRA